MTREEALDRLIEFAEVGRSLPARGSFPAEYGTAWPEFTYLFEDRVNWSSERHTEEAEERLAARHAASSRSAHGRAEEFGRWLHQHVKEDRNRIAAVKWATFKAKGRVQYVVNGEPRYIRRFKDWCENVAGIEHRTGQRRKDRAIADIVFAVGTTTTIGNTDISLSLFPEAALYNEISFDEPTPTAWMAPDARPADIPEQRDFSWAAKQTERHKRLMAHLAGEEV